MRISRTTLSDWLHRNAHDEAHDRSRLSGGHRLRIDCRRAPSDVSWHVRCLQALANHHALAILRSAPEVRVLPSTGVTRPQQSYDPVGLPLTPPPRATLRPLPSCQTGLPRLPEPPFQRAVPTTPADRMGADVDYFPIHTAFPVMQAGRHPHHHFRGLLRLHSRYGPLDCSTARGGLCHEASTRSVSSPLIKSVVVLSIARYWAAKPQMAQYVISPMRRRHFVNGLLRQPPPQPNQSRTTPSAPAHWSVRLAPSNVSSDSSSARLPNR